MVIVSNAFQFSLQVSGPFRAATKQKVRGEEKNFCVTFLVQFCLVILKTADCFAARLLSPQGFDENCVSVNNVNMCSCLDFNFHSLHVN